MKATELGVKRKNSDLTQEALKDHLEISLGTVIDIERGRIGIDDETYERIDGAIDDLSAAKKQVQAVA